MKNIKDLYNEVESDKKNSVTTDKCTCDCSNCCNSPEYQKEFIEEHKELIKVLREGSREELLAMAEEQEEELEDFMKEIGMPEDTDESTENE